MTAQGQSLSTLDKERQLAGMFALNMRIVRAKCPDATYYHFDLNAGSGWNDEYDVPGSPLVFCELAEEHLPKWEALFFEHDATRAAALQQKLRGIPRCTVHAVDNDSFLAHAGRLNIRKNADVGSVLADPNGWLYRNRDGAGCPVGSMLTFFAGFPRIDFLANLNGRTYRMMRGAERNGKATYSHLYGLEEFRTLFGKRHGLVGRSNNGHSDFVRVILRNIRTNDYRALGWYDVESPFAQKLYRCLESIDEEDGQTAFGFGEPCDG